MHSTNSENIGLLKPGLQSENDDHNHHQCSVNNLKRKSYYELTAIVDEQQQHSPPLSKIFKRSDSDHHDHHETNNHHHHHNHHICNDDENNIGICANIDNSVGTINNDDNREHMEFIDKYIVDHNNGTVELVNIMFDNNHLISPIVQHNNSTQSMTTTDGNYINYATDVVDTTDNNATSWTNVELLDLDQRGYYYSAMESETMNDSIVLQQEKQSPEVTTTVPS